MITPDQYSLLHLFVALWHPNEVTWPQRKPRVHQRDDILISSKELKQLFKGRQSCVSRLVELDSDEERSKGEPQYRAGREVICQSETGVKDLDSVLERLISNLGQVGDLKGGVMLGKLTFFRALSSSFRTLFNVFRCSACS